MATFSMVPHKEHSGHSLKQPRKACGVNSSHGVGFDGGLFSALERTTSVLSFGRINAPARVWFSPAYFERTIIAAKGFAGSTEMDAVRNRGVGGRSATVGPTTGSLLHTPNPVTET